MFICGSEKRESKVGHVLKVEGRDHPEMNAVFCAGDIVGLLKVEDMHVNQILHEVGEVVSWEAVLPEFPRGLRWGLLRGMVGKR